MATGERKWASSSTRRSGMTVLGKVAVPKPINLPSQKLENHGMDPNAEIVPKGTLSWGSRSGSSASNPWGTSPLSMNTDNGRPSSGGSGTRPSTGGSEKYESTANARGSDSRPSSASGALITNQASGTTLRPHSADTRPGSSHLSRFAETSSENSGSWADAGSGDQPGHLKKEKFSLASGDFPTLGSEKEDPPKNAHPSPQGGEAIANARINSDNLNHGRRDNQPYEDRQRPNMERWHEDAPPQNPNIPEPPQHFAPWHGAPVGTWYRGPPGAHYVRPSGPPYGPLGASPYGPAGGPPYGPSNIPPYGPLIGPGGFPIERPYYHPPLPAPPLGNSQTVPHHSVGPRVVHQNNGEMHRPSNPDGHFRPGMPMRPGFFPGPVPYDGFYPLPMGYCGPNDRDIPYLGPVGGPGVYDRHPIPDALEHINSQSASGRHGSNEKPSGPEHGVSGHRHNPHEQYKVLLKHHGQDHEWEDGAAANDSQFERGYFRRPSHEKDQGAGSNDGEKPVSRGTSNVGGRIRDFRTHGHGGPQFHQSGRVTDEAKSMKGVSDAEKNIQDKASASENVVAPKDSGLLRKIEGLNAKARGADGTQDTPLNSNQDEGKNRSSTMSNAPYISNDSTHYKSHGSGILSAPSSHGTEAVGGSDSSRKFSNSGRTAYRGKGKSGFLETEGRHKFAHSDHFPTAASSIKSDPVRVKVQTCSNMVAGEPDSSFEGKDVVPNSGSVSDPIDIQAQRAMKKEIAMQRAIQLQREEEDRNKEQKAKAQAKLEELDRRTKLMESSTEKEPTADKAKLAVDNTEVAAEKDKTTSPGGEIDGKEGVTHPEQLGGAATVQNANTIVIGTRILDPQLQIPKDDLRGNVTFPRQSTAEREGGYHKIDARGEPQHNGGKNNALKSKNKGYKERQIFQHEKVASETIVKVVADTLRCDNEAGEEVSKNVITLAEPEVHHRTKSDKIGKNKNKLEDTLSSVVVRAVAPNISDVTIAPVDIGKLQSPNLAEATHGQAQVISRDLTPSTEPNASQLKEGQIRINNHSRYQCSHKQTKNQHGHKAVDKTHDSDTVVWAPVRQHNKEATEDSSLNMVSEATADHIAKSDHVQSNIKNKRAEIARYVPKPVAKELAHQGSNSQPISPGTSMVGSAAARVETAVENKNADHNRNRQDRVPGEWQQRVSAEASHRKGRKDNTFDESIASKKVPLPDSHETREEKKFSDGWNSPDESKTTAYKAPDASVQNFKDHESFTRGKRHFSKGTRNTGTHIHDREHRKGQTGKDVDIEHSQSVNSNSDEQDRTTHKEPRREGGHPASHWHTRPYDSAADNRRIRAGGVYQNSGRDINRFVKKEPALHGYHFQPQDVKFTITGVVSDRPHGPEKTDSSSKANSGPQHERRERKTATPPVGSYSSNPNPPTQVEQPPPKEHQHEHPHSSSGMRRNNNQNIRNVRGQESQGDWNLFEQDKRHHNQPSGRGRHRHPNSHFEYKPKGQGQGQGQGQPASAEVGQA